MEIWSAQYLEHSGHGTRNYRIDLDDWGFGGTLLETLARDRVVARNSVYGVGLSCEVALLLAILHRFRAYEDMD